MKNQKIFTIRLFSFFLFLLFLFSGFDAEGQCNIVTTPPNASEVSVNINMTSSTVNLDQAALNGIANPADGGAPCTGCKLWLEAPTGTWNDLSLPGGVTFSCNGAAGSFPQGDYNLVSSSTMPVGGCTSTPITLHVSLTDTGFPVLTVPADVTIECDANRTPSGAAGQATATDNCSTPSVSYSDDVSGLTLCNGTGTIIRTWTADDSNGNVTTNTQTITIVDTTNPVLNSPGDVTIDCSVSPSPMNTGQATATDNCGTPTVTYADVTVPGACTGSYVINRTWTATDDCGNSISSSAQVITVQDNTGPSFTGAGTQVPDASPYNMSAYYNNTATTPCGINFGAAVGGDVHTAIPHLSVTAVDDCSAPVTYSWTVTPTPSGGVGGGATYDASQFYPPGTYTITYTATDACGNSSNHILNLDVVDDLPPVISNCPGNISVSTVSGDCSNTASWTEPTAADNCGGAVTMNRWTNNLTVNLLGTGTAHALFPSGVTTVFYEFSDGVNKDTCSFTVTVDDGEAPVAQCKNISVTLDAFGNYTVGANEIDNGSYDNCDSIAFRIKRTSDPVAAFASDLTLDCDDVGNVPVTLEVSDGVHKDTCTATIEVVDDISPTVICSGNFTVGTSSGAPGDCLGEATFQIFPALDNCDVTLLMAVAKAGGDSSLVGLVAPGWTTYSAFEVGENSVYIAGFDESGNVDICSFNVTVVDDEPPVINGISSFTVNDTLKVSADAGLCGAVVTWSGITATDACSNPVTITTNHLSGDVFPVGPTTVVVTATDGAGNNTTDTFVVFVEDNVPPLAQCKPITRYVDDNMAGGTVTVNGAEIDNGSSDDCGIASRKISIDGGLTFSDPVVFDCGLLGENNVLLEIADAAGNTDVCNTTITILDTFPPHPVCVNISRDLSATSPGSVTVQSDEFDTAPPSSWDNCGIVSDSISLDQITWATSLDFGCADVDNSPITVYRKLTDGSGNFAICNSSITIHDVTHPTISCSGLAPVLPLTNDIGQCTANYEWMHPTPSDNCAIAQYTYEINGVVSPAHEGVFVDYDFPVGTTTVIYEVFDEHGLSSTCSFDVIVEDNEDPVITCPGDMTIYTSSGGALCEGDATWTHPTPTDNCDIDYMNMAVTETSGTTNYPNVMPGISFQTLLDTGVNVITYDVWDIHGNHSTCSFNITVIDDEVPVFDYCPVSVTFDNVAGTCGNDHSWTRPVLADVTDCHLVRIEEMVSDAGVQQFLSTDHPYNDGSPGDVNVTASFPVGVTTITYTAYDAAGNISTCTHTVTILDNEAPSIVCPGDLNLGTVCATASLPDYVNQATVTDNCGNYTVSQSPVPGTALSDILGHPPVAGETIDVTLTATDNAPNGLQSSCTFTVTLVSTDDPIPYESSLTPVDTTCGSFIVAAPKAYLCDSLMYGIPTNAGFGNDFYQIDDSTYNFGVGDGNVLWTYSAANGHTSSQFQLITITEDTRVPNCFANDTTLYLDGAGMAAVTAVEIDNGSYDNCDPMPALSLDKTSFACADIGANTVTLTVTDSEDNASTCNATVTVVDNIAPMLVGVPADMTVSCDAVPSAPTVTATDNCTNPQTVVYSESSDQYPDPTICAYYNYHIYRTWTADDGHGNVTSMTQVITVEDTVPPVFDPGIQTTITKNTDLGQCGAQVDLVISSDKVSDNCAEYANLFLRYKIDGGYWVNSADASGMYSTGTHTVTFEAWDCAVSGIPATLVFTIEVTDNEPPIIACVNNLAFTLPPSGQLVVDPLAIAGYLDDNCTSLHDLEMSLSLSQDTFTCEDATGQLIPDTLYVMDAAGNQSFCSTFIQIQDNIDPVADCVDSLDVYLDDQGSVTFDASLLNANSADNCNGALTFTVDGTTTPSYACRDKGANQVFLFVTDPSGNDDVCATTLNVLDTIPPEAVCQPVSVYLDNFGHATLDAVDVNDGSFDNCGHVTFSLSNTAFDCSNVGTSPVTLTVTDDSGLTDVCDADVTVIDSVPPLLYCNDMVVELDAAGAASIVPDDVIDVATDACGIDTKAVDIDEFDCTDTSPDGVDVIVTVADNNGNESTCAAVVYVEDNLNPSITCSDTVIISLANEEEVIDANTINVLVDDNCAVDHVNLSKTIFDCSDVELYTPVVSTVYDDSGNTNTCMTMVYVLDDSGPVASCQDLIVALNGNTVTVTPDQINDNSTDLCGVDLLGMTVAPNTFDCGDLGANAVTLTVSDINGNTSTCEATVTVLDDENPVADCIGTPLEVYVDATGVATITADQLNDNSTDNCTDAANLQFAATQVSFDCSQVGNTEAVTLTVTDESGNFSTCLAAVNVNLGALGFTAGTVEGPAGTTISVPVTVENFLNITSYQFTVTVNDATVGTLIGVTPLEGVANFSSTISGNSASISWFGSAMTLADMTELFTLQVALGNTPSTSSPVTFSNAMLTIEASQECPDLETITPNITAGSVSVNNSLPLVTISGNISRPDDSGVLVGVAGVTVEMTGDVVASTVTDANGDYSFDVVSGSNVTITPVAVNSGAYPNERWYTLNQITATNVGVTSVDLAVIQQHITSPPVITSPYKLISADASGESLGQTCVSPNGHPYISVLDLLQIQAVIIGSQSSWGNAAWVYVPAAYTFADADCPWDPAFPQSITLTSITADQSGNDFIANKTGDVIFPGAPQGFDGEVEGRSSDKLIMTTTEKSVVTGEQFDMTFAVKGFDGILAAQFTLDFDPEKVDFVTLTPNDIISLNAGNFGVNRTTDGHITFVWYDSEAHTLADGVNLFTVRFTAKENMTSVGDIFDITSTVTPAVAYTADQSPIEVGLEVEGTTGITLVQKDGFALYQNKPNPWTDYTTIAFEMPKANHVVIEIFDVKGQLIKMISRDFDKGYNEVRLNSDDIPSNGVYMYKLQTAGFTGMQRMTIIK